MPWTFFDSSGRKLNTASTLIDNLDIDGATDIGAAIVDADLFIIDDGAGGTNRKTAASRLKTYADGVNTITNGTSVVYTVAHQSTGFTLVDDYKFTITIASSGEGLFFKCADQGSEQAAIFFTDISTQAVKICGGSKWATLDAGQTGSDGDGFFDADSRVITIYNREGNNRVITVHAMGRIASVTAPASI